MIGSFRVAWHSIFAFVGMLAGAFVSIRCARYLVRDERIYPFAIAVVIGGLVGARIAHVTDNWALYANDPVRALQFWSGGIGTMGAPIGSTIAGYLAARRLRLPVGFMFDISVIGIAVGEAIGRIGDIVNGEHHSVPCADLPWCVRYTHPSTLGQSTSVHPTGAYDGLLMLATSWALGGSSFLSFGRTRCSSADSSRPRCLACCIWALERSVCLCWCAEQPGWQALPEHEMGKNPFSSRCQTGKLAYGKRHRPPGERHERVDRLRGQLPQVFLRRHPRLRWGLPALST